jgi:hypothetical protein
VKQEEIMADWLPGAREGQLNMAKVWISVINVREKTWEKRQNFNKNSRKPLDNFDPAVV